MSARDRRAPQALEKAIEIVGCGPRDRPPTRGDYAAVLGRVQGLRCAPPPLRGAPRAPWTRPPRGSRSALIVGGRSVSSNGKRGHARPEIVLDVLGARSPCSGRPCSNAVRPLPHAIAVQPRSICSRCRHTVSRSPLPSSRAASSRVRQRFNALPPFVRPRECQLARRAASDPSSDRTAGQSRRPQSGRTALRRRLVRQAA